MPKVFSFSECVQKGNTLYNPANKTKIYLTKEGIKAINKLRKTFGRYTPEKSENSFIKKLLKLSFLKYSKNFKDITRQLSNSGPETLQWELSRECNLKCDYCFLNQQNKIEEKDPMQIMNKVLKIPFLEIVLTGGEPLILGDKLKKIIEILRKNNKGVIVYSNGYLINENWAAFFKKYNVCFFVGDDFILGHKNKSLNKKQILSMKRRGIDVGINLVLMKDNLKDTKEVIRFCKKNKIPLRFSLVLGNKRLMPSYKRCLSLFKEKIYTWESFGCGAGSKGVYMRADGKIAPCALFLGDDFLKGTKNYENIKKICKEEFPTLKIKNCEKCNLKFMCNSGCRARAYSNKKSLLSKDKVRCVLEKELINNFMKKEGYNLAKDSFYKDYRGKISKKFFKKGLVSTLKKWNSFLKENFLLTEFQNGRLVGFALFKLDEKKKIGRLSFIVVDRKFRKKGIGNKLMDRFEHICRISGTKKILFGATTKNPINFYLRRGYKIIKTADESGTKMNLFQKKF